MIALENGIRLFTETTSLREQYLFETQLQNLLVRSMFKINFWIALTILFSSAILFSSICFSLCIMLTMHNINLCVTYRCLQIS